MVDLAESYGAVDPSAIAGTKRQGLIGRGRVIGGSGSLERDQPGRAHQVQRFVFERGGSYFEQIGQPLGPEARNDVRQLPQSGLGPRWVAAPALRNDQPSIGHRESRV